MKISVYIIGALFALIAGGFYFYPLAFVWGYIAKYNPLNDFLLELAINGMPITYRVAVSIQDFFINLILMLPLALIIVRIRPTGSWIYMALALIACDAIEMFPVWTGLMGYFERVGVFDYAVIFFLTAGPGLVDYWIVRRKIK